MSNPKPNLPVLYAVQHGERVVFASSNRAAAASMAESSGQKLTIGFFLPVQGLPQRSAPREMRVQKTKAPDQELDCEQAARLKGLKGRDQIGYAIDQGMLQARRAQVNGKGRKKLLVKRSDLEAWTPGPHFRRAK